MPGRKWYLVGILVLVAGAATSGGFVYLRLGGIGRDLPQVVVPGEADLTFSQPGSYTIFFERESVVNGQYFSTTGDIAGLNVRVSSTGGSSLRLSEPAVSTSYSIGGRSGTSVLTFDVDRPGTYLLAAGYPGGRTEPRGVIAVGQGVTSRIFVTILTAIGIVFLALFVGLATIVVTFVKRYRASHSAVARPA